MLPFISCSSFGAAVDDFNEHLWVELLFRPPSRNTSFLLFDAARRLMDHCRSFPHRWMLRSTLLPCNRPCALGPGRLKPQLPSFISEGLGPHTRPLYTQTKEFALSSSFEISGRIDHRWYHSLAPFLPQLRLLYVLHYSASSPLEYPLAPKTLGPPL